MRLRLLTIFIFAACIVNISCSSHTTTTNNGKPTYELKFTQTSIPLKEGEKHLLTAEYNKEAAKLKYSWIVENPSIISLKEIGLFLATIEALAIGKTTITLNSVEVDLSIKCEVIVTKKGAIKILAIGNSFSEDAIEQNLYELAKSEGIELIIGNMVKGGCSLGMHWGNIARNIADYSYRKIVDGNKSIKSEPMTISNAIKEEKWDYISIQQVSGHSGLYDTYVTLPQIMSYLRKNATNPHVKFILHQTWAYSENSTHGDFANYEKDQMKMYKAIVKTTKKVAEENNINIIIPSGTAIQNGRTSALGDEFCRDGFHLNLTYGRYCAACTWFECLFNIDVRTNTYTPLGLSEFQTNVARAAAHFAVQTPYSVTDLIDFKKDPEIKEFTKPVYVNLGFSSDVPNRVSPFPWIM